jgi:hypothetical protein
MEVKAWSLSPIEKHSPMIFPENGNVVLYQAWFCVLPAFKLYVHTGSAAKLCNQPLDEPRKVKARLVTHTNQSIRRQGKRVPIIWSYITRLEALRCVLGPPRVALEVPNCFRKKLVRTPCARPVHTPSTVTQTNQHECLALP